MRHQIGVRPPTPNSIGSRPSAPISQMPSLTCCGKTENNAAIYRSGSSASRTCRRSSTKNTGTTAAGVNLSAAGDA